MNGALTIKGRRRDGVELEAISREYWAVASISFGVATGGGRWTLHVMPHLKTAPERIAKLLTYDQLLVDSLEFERLWPEA
jgi:hypothetical protein